MRLVIKNVSPLVKILVAVYFTAGFVFALAPAKWFPPFYLLPLMSKLAFASLFFIILPALIFKPNNEKEKKSLSKLQVYIAISLFINGLGGLGLYKLYKYGFQYDKLTHYVTPLILTIAFFEFVIAWKGWGGKKAALFSGSLVFVSGIIWEFLEVYSDSILGTTLVGLGGTNGTVDTIWDVIFNTLGIISAIVYVYLKRRRLPTKALAGKSSIEPRLDEK